MMIERGPACPADTGGKKAGACLPSHPSRVSCKVADPFTVHGHRLSSLYRDGSEASFPFIVLKILMNLRPLRAMRCEYLGNDEAGSVRA
jgi:hypothetical protein